MELKLCTSEVKFKIIFSVTIISLVIADMQQRKQSFSFAVVAS